MIIYRIYNKINNKSYIGQSVKSCFNQRYAGGVWWEKPSNSYLIRSAKKYGKENFEVEILRDDIENLDLLYELESYYANLYNSYRPNGYNLIPCGCDKENKELKHVLLGREYNKPEKFTSNYKGVYYRKSNKKWTCGFNNAMVRKSKTLNSEIEAAEMYDKVAIYLYGDDAFINFEDKREYYLSLDLYKFYINEFEKRKKSNLKPLEKELSEIFKVVSEFIWLMPIPKISEKTGYKENQIRYCIKKYKMDSPGKYYWHQKGLFNVRDDSEMVKSINILLNEGLKIKDISQKLKYTIKQIRYCIKKNHLK